MPDGDEARRERILARIAAKEARLGPHRARGHPDRAAQFKPFAALAGYEEELREREAAAASEEGKEASAPRDGSLNA